MRHSLFWAKLAMKTLLLCMCIAVSLGAGRAKKRVEHVGNIISPDEVDPEDIRFVGVMNRTFLLPNVVMKDGVLFAVRGYLQNKIVQIQIWRPVDFWRREYKLVDSTFFESKVTGGWETVYIKDVAGAKCIAVAAGDRLGIVQAERDSIPYIFSNSDTIPGSLIYIPQKNNTKVTLPKNGDVVNFEQLALPYHFVLSAFIDTHGFEDEKNPACPENLSITHTVTTSTAAPTTSTKPTVGIRGPPGPQGEQGPAGPQGPRGVPGTCTTGCGTPKTGAQKSDSEKESVWQSVEMSVGVIIWLVALTIINMSLVAIICCGCRQMWIGGVNGGFRRTSSVNENVRETVREYNYRGGAGASTQPTGFTNRAFTSDDSNAIFANKLNTNKL